LVFDDFEILVILTRITQIWLYFNVRYQESGFGKNHKNHMVTREKYAEIKTLRERGVFGIF